ncbi:chemotaxis protein CheB [Pseudomonas salmasensis]|nr:chemotaxis protein CheB [Pseudomonas salmasensis]QXH77976.1 chemotaxis protein CheB [Pseudomonas salmasensis]
MDANNAADQVVVIGTSTGGLHALTLLFNHLPSDLPAAVFVTMHIGNNFSSLPSILSKNTALKVSFAKQDEAIKKATFMLLLLTIIC